MDQKRGPKSRPVRVVLSGVASASGFQGGKSFKVKGEGWREREGERAMRRWDGDAVVFICDDLGQCQLTCQREQIVRGERLVA